MKYIDCNYTKFETNYIVEYENEKYCRLQIVNEDKTIKHNNIHTISWRNMNDIYPLYYYDKAKGGWIDKEGNISVDTPEIETFFLEKIDKETFI